MSQTKQNIWVVTILFASLMSSVAFSYVITPVAAVKTQSITAPKQVQVNPKSFNMNISLKILLPKVVK